MEIKRIAKEIRRHKSFLITTHINMEGDALGSLLAMRGLLLSLAKSAVMVSADKVPAQYDFIPQARYVKRPSQIKKDRFDCLIALDCSDPSRCREVMKRFAEDKTIINIDHHISNSRFADLNWIDPKASSTAEMVYRLYKYMGVALDKERALFLYIGLVTDTGSFRYPNTSPFSHFMAGQLLRHGLKVNRIYRNIYENLKFEDLKLLNKVLDTFEQDKSGKVVWFQIDRQLLKQSDLSFDLAEKVLNFGRLNKRAEVIILFKEELERQNQIRVNFRSQGSFDVNKIARVFSGGGHKTASGCRIEGKLETVKRRVLAKIEKTLK